MVASVHITGFRFSIQLYVLAKIMEHKILQLHKYLSLAEMRFGVFRNFEI